MKGAKQADNVEEMTYTVPTDTLMKFCATEPDDREHLRKPMTYNGNTVFTNARIVVSVPWRGEFFTLGPRILQSPSQLENLYQSRLSQPIDLSCLEPKACEHCNGTLIGNCRECEGTGTARAYGNYRNYDVPCRSCETQINRECLKCDDTGYQTASISFDDFTVDTKYIAKVRSLLGKYGLTFRCVDHKRDKTYLAIRFDFGGGHGFIMTMRKPVEGSHQNLDIPVIWGQVH